MPAAGKAVGTRPQSYELVIIEPDGETTVLPIAEGQTTIGSDLACQVLVNNGSVAPQHAELFLTHEGELWVRDLAGRQSTLVNGVPTARAQLEDGTFLKLGQVDMTIRRGGANSGQHGTVIRKSGAGELPALSPPVRPASSVRNPAMTPGTEHTMPRSRDGRLSSGLRPQPPLPGAGKPPSGGRISGVRRAPLAPRPEDDEYLNDPTNPQRELPDLDHIGPGTIIAERYQVLSKIAEGGMGEVYKGVHIELEKPVAIKVMRRELSDDPGFADRFKREAIAASRIGQQNICDVSDFGRTPGGMFYFVMEFLDGQTLGQIIRDRGALPVSRAIHILHQLCQALASAHHANIVHRDLKPENVMILQRPGQQDFVKVLDFGVAKLPAASDKAGQTQAGMVVGTPQYMAPEQASALATDARTDIYALGLIFYEMLQGRPTFKEETPALLMAAQIYKAPPPLTFGSGDSMPEALQKIVKHMLMKKPEDRPQTMEAVIEELQTAQAELMAPVAKLATPAFTPPVRPSEVAAMMAAGAPRADAPSQARPPTPAPAQAPSGVGPADAPPDLADTAPHADDLAALAAGKKAGGRRAVVAGLALLAFVGTGAAVVAMGAGGSKSDPVPAVSQLPPLPAPPPTPPLGTAPTPPPPPVADPAPAKPAMVTVTLNSEPVGAEIFSEGALVGKTPMQLQWEKAKVVTFKFSLAGFQSEERKIAPLADFPLDVTLKKVQVARPTKPKVQPEALKDDPYGGQVEDIKDSPY